MTKKLVASRLRQAPSAEESRSHMGMSFVGDPRKKKSRFSSGQGPNRPKKKRGSSSKERDTTPTNPKKDVWLWIDLQAHAPRSGDLSSGLSGDVRVGPPRDLGRDGKWIENRGTNWSLKMAVVKTVLVDPILGDSVHHPA